MGDDWKTWRQAKITFVIGVLALLAVGALYAVVHFGFLGFDVDDEMTGKVVATALAWLGFVVLVCTWPLIWVADKWMAARQHREAEYERRDGFTATADLLDETADNPGCGCVWMLIVIGVAAGCIYKTNQIWSGDASPWAAQPEATDDARRSSDAPLLM